MPVNHLDSRGPSGRTFCSGTFLRVSSWKNNVQLCEAPCIPSPSFLGLGSQSAMTACVKLNHCNVKSLGLWKGSTHFTSVANTFLWWHNHRNMTSSSFNSTSSLCMECAHVFACWLVGRKKWGYAPKCCKQHLSQHFVNGHCLCAT